MSGGGTLGGRSRLGGAGAGERRAGSGRGAAPGLRW